MVHGVGRAWLDDVTLSADGVPVSVVTPSVGRPWKPADPSLRPVTATPGWYDSDPDFWLAQHNELLAITAKNRGACDILWFGDSIGRGWGGRGGDDFIPEWRAAFGQYKTLNYSIPGDAAENVLWRMLHGEGDGIFPRLVVIAIGTNNLWDPAVPPDAVAAGVKRCAKVARRRFPNATVLVLAPLPIAREASAPNRVRLDTIRAQILNLFRVTPDAAVRVFNCSRKFIEPDGTLSPDVFPDYIHPSSIGYARYAEYLKPVITKALSR
jgi:beta-glucosidase